MGSAPGKPREVRPLLSQLGFLVAAGFIPIILTRVPSASTEYRIVISRRPTPHRSERLSD